MLLHIADPATAGALSNAIRAEGLRPLFRFRASDDLKRTVLEGSHPSLALYRARPSADRRHGHVSGDPAGTRAADPAPCRWSSLLPGRYGLREAAGVTDWLIKPSRESFIRTKVRAWVLRTACRWMRAGIPRGRGATVSLAAPRLKDYSIPPLEDRFDRITRLAAALFNVPVALVSLVDENRQWFKSRHGLEVRGRPRGNPPSARRLRPAAVWDCSRIPFPGPRFADNPLVAA